MLRRQRIILALMTAFCIISVIMASGCAVPGNDQAHESSSQEYKSQNIEVTVSWKDFYPDHDDRTKAEIIEKAKDEIMRLFPGIDRSTLYGNWVEHERYNYAGMKQIGSPYIKFEDVRYTLGESRDYMIHVDPEQMKVIYYSPNTAQYGQAIISYKEAKEKAIEFIRKAQGDNSIVDDPDAYSYSKKSYTTSGIPVTYITYSRTHDGVEYQQNTVSINYDMRRDKVERYSDDLTDPQLLSGLSVLSPEPYITYDEAIEVLEEMMSEEYNIEEAGLEYVTLSNYDSYLSWWDNENLVYADNPEPLPLVWEIGITDTASRKKAEETKVTPVCGTFRIDAHTGEVTRLVYNEEAIVKTYGYMGSSNPE